MKSQRFKTICKWVVIFPVLIFLLHLVSLLSIFKKIYKFARIVFQPKTRPLVVRTPEENFHGLDAVGYTFKPNYVELPIGGGKFLPRVHYIDEGPINAKETILCLHGEPSWSFLYRKMIPILVDAGYRVIAPDFIGFGKSDKYTYTDSYTFELHTTTLRLLLDHLNVSSVTLVCQDWGGLVGLPVVKDSAFRFSRVVVMNTGLPDGTTFALSNLCNAIPFLLWQSFVMACGKFLPISLIFSRALKKPSTSVLKGYAAPFPSYKYKAGAVKWPLMVPLRANTVVASEMKATKDFLATSQMAMLIMFSDEDKITRHQAEMFQLLCPRSFVWPVKGAGHFLQEDKGEEIAANVVKFINIVNEYN